MTKKELVTNLKNRFVNMIGGKDFIDKIPDDTIITGYLTCPNCGKMQDIPNFDNFIEDCSSAEEFLKKLDSAEGGKHIAREMCVAN